MSPKRQEQTSKATRTEIVRRQLEEEIIAGLHQPGTHLDEKAQSTRLGCSRTPLREALNQLVAVGLLIRRSHRGVFIAPRDRNRILEQIEAFGEVEAACAALAADRMPAAERQRLQNPSLTEPAKLFGAVRANCGNRELTDLADKLEGQIAPYRRLEGEKGKEQDRHAALSLAHAVAKGDRAQAARLVRYRVLAMMEAVEAQMGDGESDDAPFLQHGS